MRRSILTLVTVGLAPLLSGCGDTCESVQDEIMDISREIQKNPDTAWDRATELEALKDQLVEMGCLGN